MGAVAGSIVSIAVSTAVSISTSLYAAYQQKKQARAMGKSQQAMANYNAQVAVNQEIAANQSAKAEMDAAAERANRQKAENKRLRERQRALTGASGTMGSGTNILLEEDQLAEMKLQELDILHQGELQARQYKLQAMGHASAAAGSKFQGRQAMDAAEIRGRAAVTSGWMSAAKSASSAVGSGVSSYMKYNN